MKRSILFPLLALAIAACGDQLDPASAGSSIVQISEGDTTANGTLNGAVFGAQYGAGYDTLSSPLEGVTVEVYQVVVDSEVLMTPPDTIPGDTAIVIDTIPVDTIVVDTLPFPPTTLVLRGTGVTDADGHFTVTGIPAGQYVIFIVPAESSQWGPSTGWAFVSDGAATLVGTFHLWPKSGYGPD